MPGYRLGGRLGGKLLPTSGGLGSAHASCSLETALALADVDGTATNQNVSRAGQQSTCDMRQRRRCNPQCWSDTVVLRAAGALTAPQVLTSFGLHIPSDALVQCVAECMATIQQSTHGTAESTTVIRLTIWRGGKGQQCFQGQKGNMYWRCTICINPPQAAKARSPSASLHGRRVPVPPLMDQGQGVMKPDGTSAAKSKTICLFVIERCHYSTSVCRPFSVLSTISIVQFARIDTITHGFLWCIRAHTGELKCFHRVQGCS